ncbi:MAG TPA: hypothetical protein PLP08_06240 [Plasticicumulans sp.]|uniref:COG4315 family predicted lipoprotein n=1 Tax=Plasticicumulans sp. TaxID=2307179 RepID=UPI000FB36A37|nr:hypothetical protein [Plasticicumulans sp.]RTL01064.1 MAG: hypothetical protein EKK65_07210 [Xanthomonadales bacterium]HMW28204.1 hypothetical protein [Plasticicumulans sp.]HMX54280.1 hypothetical protein [Plasticicumulans sp.]HMZ11533.1 hypothetical protein [Plasticicumulans sp.]HNF65827.1 hypothetical protein [Plasticicumulans sp.]
MKPHPLTFVLPALLLAACAASDPGAAPARVADGVWVGGNGMTLYVFDKDVAGSGRSACNGACAANWPPLAAAADAPAGGDWTTIRRDDGSRQWAWRGRPLYFWSKDTQPGQRSGDGFNQVWHVARAG